MKNIAPFGSWKSPITAEVVSGKDRGLGADLQVDALDDSIYFIESRPDEAGRQVLMRLTIDGNVHEVLPAEFNVRTRYLEYGGASFLVHAGTAYFINFTDQQIYAAKLGQAPRKLTSETKNRFADLTFDQKRNRLIGLREKPGKAEPENTICAVDITDGSVSDLVTGADFYNCARLRGDQLLWISWNHPNMPWNGSELWTADLNDLAKPNKIAGDDTHAVSQAQWGEDGSIYFALENPEFAALYRYAGNRMTKVFSPEAEFVLPDWVPGTQQYALFNDGLVIAAYLKGGRWQMISGHNPADAKIIGEPLPTVSTLRRAGDGAVAIIGRAKLNSTIVSISNDGAMKILYAPKMTEIAAEFISVAEQIEFPTENGGTGYAWFYRPVNALNKGPEGQKPPLVVMAHGGPSAMSFSSFRKDIQFWTSRGYAVADVNYGGSTGYGRTYRERLRGTWGLVDVSDCARTVEFLSKLNLIDPRRVAIRGGSAGGYTTLAALAFTKGIFAAGASYFGVSDLELLAKETHKFESRYLDQLVGPYPAAREIYQERAPLAHIDRFDCPIIFFQGDEDAVVPPNQSELMYKSLKAKGIPTEYHLYAKEGHGFRRAENNQHSLKAEHNFYARFFNFPVQTEDKV